VTRNIPSLTLFDRTCRDAVEERDNCVSIFLAAPQRQSKQAIASRIFKGAAASPPTRNGPLRKIAPFFLDFGGVSGSFFPRSTAPSQMETESCLPVLLFRS